MDFAPWDKACQAVSRVFRVLSKVTPKGVFSCQARHIARLILIPTLLLLSACAGDEKPVEEPKAAPFTMPPPAPPVIFKPPPGPPEAPELKPIEVKRLNLGTTHVDRAVEEPPPLSGQVELLTWSDERIRGRVVTETAEAYVLDTSPPGATEPRIRRVPRPAVMSLTVLPR
jgi:hypothetical protein